MRIFSTLLALGLCFLMIAETNGQAITIKGIIKDAESQQPLPYVNIGIQGKNLGVIAHENGAFEIRLLNIAPEEVLTFSILGYQTKSIAVGDIPQGQGPLVVQLDAKTYPLPEVTVTGLRNNDFVKLGRFTPTKTTTGHSGSGRYGVGMEWGIRIFNDGIPHLIHNVSFHTRFNTLDSILFRINFYRLKEDVPGESLLSKPLFVKSYKGDKWITKDVQAERLLVREDIVVSFEVVQLWYSARGDNYLFFTHGQGYEQSKTYVKASSQDHWSIKAGPPIALFVTAERLADN